MKSASCASSASQATLVQLAQLDEVQLLQAQRQLHCIQCIALQVRVHVPLRRVSTSSPRDHHRIIATMDSLLSSGQMQVARQC